MRAKWRFPALSEEPLQRVPRPQWEEQNVQLERRRRPNRGPGVGRQTRQAHGLLYFSCLPTVGFGVFSAQSLLENGASSAAAQVAASRSFLEFGVLAGALGAVTWLVLAVLFYGLFRSVSDRACKLLVVFMVACALLMLAALARRMDAISLVTQSQALGIDGDQLRVLTALAATKPENLMQASFIFSAVWLLPLGYLVFRSGFLPKTLGVLLMLGAPFYLASFVDAVFQLGYAKTPLAQVIGIVSGIPGSWESSVRVCGCSSGVRKAGGGPARRALLPEGHRHSRRVNAMLV